MTSDNDKKAAEEIVDEITFRMERLFTCFESNLLGGFTVRDGCKNDVLYLINHFIERIKALESEREGIAREFFENGFGANTSQRHGDKRSTFQHFWQQKQKDRIG